jgi:hypothetical protein
VQDPEVQNQEVENQETLRAFELASLDGFELR